MNEKKRIKNEKDLTKQAKMEEKRRIKEEKELANEIRKEEARRVEELAMSLTSQISVILADIEREKTAGSWRGYRHLYGLKV